MIRKLSAHYVFPISSPPVKFGILVIDSDKKTIELISRDKEFKEIASLEFYNGILVPGFLNRNHQADLQLFDEIKQQFLSSELLTFAEGFKSDIFGQFSFEMFTGVNLISGVDFVRMRLTSESRIKILVPSDI
jgi:hypothetical protein